MSIQVDEWAVDAPVADAPRAPAPAKSDQTGTVAVATRAAPHHPQTAASAVNTQVVQSMVDTAGLRPEKPAKLNTPGTRAIVYQAILDLTAVNRPVSRKAIVQETGLRLTQVDDHIKRFKEEGIIMSFVPGIFELTGSLQPDRAVSVTLVPTGGVKLEIGENCLDLTYREARMVAEATGGIAFRFGR